MNIYERLMDGLKKIEAMPNGLEKVALLAINGLMTDGGHHKQWYLERILEAAGFSPSNIQESLNAMGYGFDSGSAP